MGGLLQDISVILYGFLNVAIWFPSKMHRSNIWWSLIFVQLFLQQHRAHVAYCIHALARRLAKTHNWAVMCNPCLNLYEWAKMSLGIWEVELGLVDSPVGLVFFLVVNLPVMWSKWNSDASIALCTCGLKGIKGCMWLQLPLEQNSLFK